MMCSDARQQQLSLAFKETLLFRGRLLSSQEGMWPRELGKMHFPFYGHRFLELSAVKTMGTNSRASNPETQPQHDLLQAPTPSSNAPGAATDTKDQSSAGTSCWSRWEGEGRQVCFYYLCIKSAPWLDQQHKAEEGP